jgi:threonyl-tRNA synthetase
MAAAFLELFPGAYLKGGCPTKWGFYYDFLLSQPVNKEFLILLEENMRQKSKKEHLFRKMEMIPHNAGQYFASLERNDLQDRVSIIEEPLVSLVEIGSFIDLCDFPLPKTVSEITQFKLLEIIPISEGVRILGTAFFEKPELKEFVKKWEDIGERNYLKWIKELDLLEERESGWVWLPRGETLKELLIDFWKKELAKQNFQFIATPSLDTQQMFETHLKLAKERQIRTAEIASLPLFGEGHEGLLDLPHGFIDQAYIPFKKEELLSELISSLQFIVKILKMFSFDYEVVLYSKNADLLLEALQTCHIHVKQEKGPHSTIEFYLIDIFGRRWKGPSLTVRFDCGVIVQSLFSSLERFVALFLEASKGKLPLWMVPEQVRVMGFQKKQIHPVVSALQKEGIRVGMDLREENLSKRMHDALRERVPYSIVLGDRELECGTLSVRPYGVSAPEQMTIETLIDRLKKELESQ